MGNPGELNELWATGTGAANTEPPDALQLSGWSASEPPTAAHVNALFERSSRWWRYLTAAMDDASTYFYFKAASTFTSLRLHMVGGVNAWLDIDKASGEFNFQHGSGATNCLKITADGLKGPTATASASTGIRYGYPGTSKQEVRYALGPELGGYTPIREAAISGVGPVMEFSSIPRTCRLANAASSGSHVLVFRRPLLIARPTGQTTGWPVCTAFGATFSGSADDLYCRIWGVNRSTGAETALTGIISASTPTISGASYAMDPTTSDYFVEIYSNGTVTHSSTTSDEIRAVYAVVSWQSLTPTM